jgi:hypothetical protein
LFSFYSKRFAVILQGFSWRGANAAGTSNATQFQCAGKGNPVEGVQSILFVSSKAFTYLTITLQQAELAMSRMLCLA